jgi:hypothetical protein
MTRRGVWCLLGGVVANTVGSAALAGNILQRLRVSQVHNGHIVWTTVADGRGAFSGVVPVANMGRLVSVSSSR